MQTARVVKALNIGKEATFGGLARRITLVQDLFELELSKEALHGRIVVTVAGARHADLNVMLRQQRLVLGTGVVTAAVGMMQQGMCVWLALPQRHQQSTLREFVVHV